MESCWNIIDMVALLTEILVSEVQNHYAVISCRMCGDDCINAPTQRSQVLLSSPTHRQMTPNSNPPFYHGSRCVYQFNTTMYRVICGEKFTR